MSTDAFVTTFALNADLRGRYVVEREVGSGGMASVYLAHDVRHDRRVALKVLRPELAAVIGAERFLAEIRTTAKLQHPGILPLFDSGEAAGQLFYVMPFVDGETLRHRIDRERQLPVADAVRIAAEVGDALAYAHEHSVIHRDIKPENILLQGGRPVVADFGIALAVQEAGGNRLTQTGLSLGTPQYMAPEQAAGERGVDGRADQYALAAVLYEMLAGEPPFAAPSTQALIAKLMTDDARPLESLRKSVPEHVAAAVHQALEKVPADRFATTRDFVAALTSETVVSGAGRVRSQASRGRDRRRWMSIAAGTLLVGAAIGAAMDRAVRRTTTSEQPALPMVFTLEPDTGQHLAVVCCGNIFALSPDGRRIAFQATDPDAIPRLHVRDMDALTTRSLAGTENPHELFFSPDGQQVGFNSGRTLKSVDLRSRRVRTVTELPQAGFTGGGTWTTDGRIMYAVGNVLFAVPADGGTPTTIAKLDSAKKEYQIGGPHSVAGTDLVLFAVQRENGEPIIRALWMSSGRTKDVALGVAPAVVTAARVLLAVRSDGTVEARQFNVATGDTAGPPNRVVDQVQLRSPVFLHAEFAASSSGTIVTVSRSPFSASGQAVLHIINGANDEAHMLPFRAARVTRPRFSPDGKLVVALDDDLEKRLTTAFVYDPERRTTTPLAYSGFLTGVDWIGPDSVMTLTSSNEMLVQGIHGGEPRRLGGVGGWANLARLSVRGSWIVFDGERSGSSDIGIAHRDSIDHARVLLGSQLAERWPRLSPDARYIAFTVLHDGRGSVHVASFPSLTDEMVVGDGINGEAHWGRDGTLYYVETGRRIVAVTLRLGAQIGVASRIVSQTVMSGAAIGWDVDASGKRFVYGSDASNTGGPPRLVVTVNALGKR